LLAAACFRVPRESRRGAKSRRWWHGAPPVRRPAFEHGHDRKDFVDVLLRQFGDVTAASRLEHHQAFGGQHLERLAQRRAADAILQGERLLVDPAPLRQFMCENAAAQALGHLFVQGGGRKYLG
jgi:hypothetical protein